MALLTKQYRVTIDVTIDVEPINRESVTERTKFYSNSAEVLARAETWDAADRDTRLLHALLAQRSAIEELLLKSIHAKIEGLSYAEIEQKTGETRDYDDIIASVFAQIPAEDAAFYQGAIEGGLLWESASDALEAIKARITSIGVSELLARTPRGRQSPPVA